MAYLLVVSTRVDAAYLICQRKSRAKTSSFQEATRASSRNMHESILSQRGSTVLSTRIDCEYLRPESPNMHVSRCRKSQSCTTNLVTGRGSKGLG